MLENSYNATGEEGDEGDEGEEGEGWWILIVYFLFLFLILLDTSDPKMGARIVYLALYKKNLSIYQLLSEILAFTPRWECSFIC